jgi:hypothetical protein
MHGNDIISRVSSSSDRVLAVIPGGFLGKYDLPPEPVTLSLPLAHTDDDIARLLEGAHRTRHEDWRR